MKEINTECRELYTAPSCECLTIGELAVVCTSGDGGIDDAIVNDWGDF